MRKHFTLRQRLLGCCGALACVAVVAIASLPWIANRLSGELDQVANGPTRKLDMLKAESGKFQTAAQQVRELLAELRGLMVTEEEKSAFDKMEANMDTWLSMTAKVNETSIGGNPAEAAVFSQKNTRQYAKGYDKAKTELLDLQRQQMRAAGLRMQSYRSRAGWASLVGGLLALIDR